MLPTENRLQAIYMFVIVMKEVYAPPIYLVRRLLHLQIYFFLKHDILRTNIVLCTVRFFKLHYKFYFPAPALNLFRHWIHFMLHYKFYFPAPALNLIVNEKCLPWLVITDRSVRKYIFSLPSLYFSDGSVDLWYNFRETRLRLHRGHQVCVSVLFGSIRSETSCNLEPMWSVLLRIGIRELVRDGHPGRRLHQLGHAFWLLQKL